MSEDSDQTAQMRRLIWNFAGRTSLLVAFVLRWVNFIFYTSKYFIWVANVRFCPSHNSMKEARKWIMKHSLTKVAKDKEVKEQMSKFNNTKEYRHTYVWQVNSPQQTRTLNSFSWSRLPPNFDAARNSKYAFRPGSLLYCASDKHDRQLQGSKQRERHRKKKTLGNVESSGIIKKTLVSTSSFITYCDGNCKYNSQ